MRQIKIAPSMLSADFSRFGEETKSITESGADILHLDVMDGSFVKNISFGPKFIKEARPYSGLTFDAHLMIVNPWNYIERFAEALSGWLVAILRTRMSVAVWRKSVVRVIYAPLSAVREAREKSFQKTNNIRSWSASMLSSSAIAPIVNVLRKSRGQIGKAEGDPAIVMPRMTVEEVSVPRRRVIVLKKTVSEAMETIVVAVDADFQDVKAVLVDIVLVDAAGKK